MRKPNDILAESTLKALLDEWKADYTAWMNQSSQNAWYSIKASQRREWTRTRFRNFFFKMCGNYDLFRFWLRVPASWMSLRIFKEVFVDGQEKTTIKMNRAVEADRDAIRDAER